MTDWSRHLSAPLLRRLVGWSASALVPGAACSLSPPRCWDLSSVLGYLFPALRNVEDELADHDPEITDAYGN